MKYKKCTMTQSVVKEEIEKKESEKEDLNFFYFFLK